jgi:hypothetical protein
LRSALVANKLLVMHRVATSKHVVPAETARLIVSPQAYPRPRELLDASLWLRSVNPPGRVEIDDFDPFWIVTRHADIIALSRQHDLVLNGDRATALVPRATDEQVAR